MLSHRLAALVVLPLALVLAFLAPARAQRPAVPQILPKETVLLVRVPDSRDLVTRFKETSIGKIGSDEKIKPLVQHLYGSATKAFEVIEDRLGVSLTEILSIPQGEAAFALVTPDKKVAPILFVEVGDKAPAVQKLLEVGQKAAVENGAERSTQRLAGVDVELLTNARDGGKVYYVLHDKCLLISTDATAFEDFLRIAKGDGLRVEREPLLKNEKFAAIMSKCMVNKDTPAQMMWFIDPIELAMVATRGNAGAATALALLPVIGLDGVQAAGGTMSFATEEFDSIMHNHLLLANPRSGVLEALTLGGGDTEPEPWVPGDAAGYMTMYWDVQESYNVIEKLLDTLRGEGSTARTVDRAVSGPTGADFRKDLLPALDGRFTMVTWMEPPARFNSQATLLAVKLRDAKAFQTTLDTMVAKFDERLEKKTSGGVMYWQAKRAEQPAAPADQPPQPGRPQIRGPFAQMQPCFAVLGGYLMIADRPGMLERAIAQSANPAESLASNLEYKLIAARIRKQLSGVRPGMVSFNRPEEGLRNLYQMATNEENLIRLGQQAEGNPFFRALHEGLKENPLPPFSVVSQYLAPGGSLLVNDQTGLHHISFSIRRKQEAPK